MGRGRKPFVFRMLPAVFAAAMVLAACGDGTVESIDDPGSDGAEVPEGEGLALRLTGSMADGLLCPGGQRPCFVLDREVDADSDGLVRLVGRLVDGVVIVETEEEVPLQNRDYPDRCEGKTAGGGDRQEVTGPLDGYRRSISDRYAIQWISNTNVFHFGVVGDAADVEQAIADLGIGDDICVVGGFAKSEADLMAISAELGDVVNSWPENRRRGGSGWAPDPFEGFVSMDVFRADAQMLDDVATIGDGAVRVFASIEVLNGTLEELDSALDASPNASPAPAVTMNCGDVVFPEMPADPSVFPPLDAEAEEAFQSMMDGPAGGEGMFLFDGFTWSIASRTDTEMVLFGQAPAGENTEPEGDPPYADATFRRAGDGWVVNSFGQCRLQVSALGLGPATMILDPAREPDPTSTELPVLINERNCASGEAPVDREILPVVTETDTTVEITVFVAPVTGAANCQGNPFHPIVITLEDPLGDRTVIDATTQPGKARSWPPTQEDLNG